MKINLLRDSQDIMSGYLNIDQYGSSPDVTIGEVENLDYVCDDAQCVDLIARDILDYVTPDKIDAVLGNWVSKIRHGGKITIGGTDMFLVSMKHFRGDIDTDVASMYLYGRRLKPHQFKKNMSTLSNVANCLANSGFKILLKKYEEGNCSYVVTAERP